MESIKIKPEKDLQTMWFFETIIGSLIVLILLIMGSTFDSILRFYALLWAIINIPFLLYIPAFYKTLEYIIDNDSIKTQGGVFWKKYSSLTYAKITNIDITQDPVQRMFNIGTIHVQTAGAGGTQGTLAELRLLGIKNLQGLKNTIMNKIKESTLSRSNQPKETVEKPENNTEILQGIWEELKIIRKNIEKN